MIRLPGLLFPIQSDVYAMRNRMSCVMAEVKQSKQNSFGVKMKLSSDKDQREIYR